MNHRNTSVLCLALASLALWACGSADEPKAPQAGVAAAPAPQTTGSRPSVSKLNCKDLSGTYSRKVSANERLEISIKQAGCVAIRIEATRNIGKKTYSWKIEQNPVDPARCRISKSAPKTCHRHEINASSYVHEVWSVDRQGNRASIRNRETYRLASDGTLVRTTELHEATTHSPRVIRETLLPR